MEVKFQDKIIRFNGREMVDRILKKLGINREEVLVIKNGNLITEKDFVEDGERIEILRVSRGG